jgi:hypothetical protein
LVLPKEYYIVIKNKPENNIIKQEKYNIQIQNMPEKCKIIEGNTEFD